MTTHFRFPADIVRQMKVATDDVVSMLGADGGSIWLHDGAGWFRPAADRGLAADFGALRHHKVPYRTEDGTVLIEQFNPLIVNVAEAEKFGIDDQTISACREVGIGGFWVHRIMPAREVMGNLSVVFREAREPTERDIAFLGSLAYQVGAALEQNRALTDARGREAALELLGDVSRLIASSNDVRQVMRAVADHAHKLVGASTTRILLHEPDGALAAAAATRGHWRDFADVRIQPGEPSLALQCLVDGTQVNPDTTVDDRGLARLNRRFGTLAYAAVPMVVAGVPVGVMIVDDRIRNRHFEDEEIQYLEMIANVAAVAIHRDGLLDHLRGRERELAALSVRLVDAQEQERRRIAQELSSLVGRRLKTIEASMVNIRTQLFGPEAPGPDSIRDARSRCASIRDQVQEIVQSTRRMSAGLHPGILEDLGLVPALRWYCGEVSRHSKVEVDLMAPESLDVAAEIMRTVYRVAQESIDNVLRHAGASRCSVALRSDPDGIVLSVEDDGKGFDMRSRRLRGRLGIGLLGMGERARHLGGTLDVQSEVGAGTRVELTVPTTTPQ